MLSPQISNNIPLLSKSSVNNYFINPEKISSKTKTLKNNSNVSLKNSQHSAEIEENKDLSSDDYERLAKILQVIFMI